ncbi:hypothetical protein [Affinibrenneria salicis]|nr:hypothetical protein [Affinibrenneria salicis]
MADRKGPHSQDRRLSGLLPDVCAMYPFEQLSQRVILRASQA